MKWPFVRRSFHDNIVSKLIDREIRLDEEINRLNQELANELNSHRETKKKAKSLVKYWQERCLRTEKELEEIKDALKIAQEDNEKIKKLNDKWWKAIKKFVLEINISKTDCW